MGAVLAFSVCVVVTTLACGPGPAGEPEWVVTRSRVVSDKVDELNFAYAGPHMPGGIVAVLQGGEVIHLKGYGFANREFEVPWDPTIRYTFFSMTKSMTASAMLRLQEQGRLSLDDRIQKHLPDFPTLEHTITIRHLLTHTSGLYEDETLIHLVGTGAAYSPITLDELYELGKRQSRLPYRPGSYFYYNDTGMRFSARIIERVTGLPFGEAMRDLVFGPAGMATASIKNYEPSFYPRQATSYELGGDPRPDPTRDPVNVLGIIVETSGDGAAVGSMNDLIQYARHLAALDARGSSLMERLAEPVYYREGVHGSYRMSIEVLNHRGLRVLGHGGLYGKYFAYVPDLDLWVLLMYNAIDVDRKDLIQAIIDAVLGSDPRHAKWLAADNPEAEARMGRRPRRQDFSQDEVARLAGRHLEPESGFTIEIAPRDDRLVFQAFGQEGDLVRDEEPGSYRTDPGGSWPNAPLLQLVSQGEGLGLLWADWPQPRPLHRLAEGAGKAGPDLSGYHGLYRSREFGVVYEITRPGPGSVGDLALRIGSGARRSDRFALTRITGDLFEGRPETEGTFLNQAPFVRFRRRASRVGSLELYTNDVRTLELRRLGVLH